MKSDVNFITCEFEAEIVSYLYGELAAANRTRFETHLLDCTPCTDEFAELAFSRFSVFEWQKEEFAPLKTPAISIPYPAKQLEALESDGYLAGFRRLLAFNWQTGIATAGILTVFIGIGFAVMNYNGTDDQNLAVVEVNKEEVKITSPIVVPSVPATVIKVEEDDSVDIPTAKAVRRVQQTKIATEVKKSKAVRTQTLNPPRLADGVAERMPVPLRRNAPALTADIDDDDRSLRLTDLFDEDDTKL